MTRGNPGARLRGGTWAYLILFGLYSGGSVLWLGLGLVPSLVPSVAVLRHGLESLAAGTGVTAAVASRLLTYGGSHTAWLPIDYLFSALNVALALLLTIRRPRDPIPRLLAVAFVGTAATFNAPSHELFHAIGDVPVITGLHFAFHVISGVAYLWAVLLYPDGRLPLAGVTARRRAVATSAVVSTLIIAYVCYLGSFVAHPPFFVVFFGILTPAVGMIAQRPGVRGADRTPAQRQQSRLLRWALAPALAIAAVWLAAHLAAFVVPGAAWGPAVAGAEVAFPAVFAVVPVTLFVAILRYRLWDIDIVVSRAVGYGMLVVFISAVYFAVLVGAGWLIGARGWSELIALAVVAVAIQAARDRLRALANRVVFGQRLSPPEVMRVLANRLAQASSTDELRELTAVVVDGTRCAAAELWLVMDDHLLLASVTPGPIGHAARTRPLAAANLGACHAATGADLCVPVTHEGELLAVLALGLPVGVALPKAEARLIVELAGHAGLLVANARLTEHLARQVESITARTRQLRRSRLRIVAAQDDERRRLERDIHDGAQQELVALMIHLRALRRSTGDSGTDSGLASLRRSFATTRAAIAALCTGNPPQVLAATGLGRALEVAAGPVRRSGPEVRVIDACDGRLPIDVECALYFCALEAMQNVNKHARANRVTVRGARAGDEATLSVRDDGVGFDAASVGAGSGLSNMVDRLTVLGGTARITAAPGAGVDLSFRVPLRQGGTRSVAEVSG